MRHTLLWSCTHIPNKYYIRNNDLTLRSRSHKGHYGTWHTTLWSCTHIPNIIDLSRRQKCYDPEKKILFKKQLFDLEVKGQGTTKVITVCDTLPYGHAPTWFFRYRPIRNKNCLWWPCLLTDRDEMSNLHRGHYIDASYQASLNLGKRFQRRRFKKIGQSETRIACGGHVW